MTVEPLLDEVSETDRPALRRTWALAGGAAPEAPPPAGRRAATWAAVEARLDAPPEAPRPDRPAVRRAGRHRRWAAGVAGAVAVAAGVWAGLPVGVTAPAGTTRTVTLADGSAVHLAGGSSLRFGRLAPRRVRLDGEAYFEVARDAARPFVVATPRADVAVLGTAFDVRSEAGVTDVAVAHGRVAVVRHADDRRVEVGAGERVRVAEGAAYAVRPAGGPVEAWRRGGFRVEDAPLGEVFDAVGRRFGVRVEASAAVRARPWTVVLPGPVTARSVLDAVALPAGLVVTPIPDGFRVADR